MRSRGTTGGRRSTRLVGWFLAGFVWLASISGALLPAWERRSRWFLLVPVAGVVVWLALWRRIGRRHEWEMDDLVACGLGGVAAIALAVALSVRL